jgi:hypothetical protein
MDEAEATEGTDETDSKATESNEVEYDGKAWEEVLMYMYEEMPESASATITDDHPFVTETDLAVDEAERAAAKLSSWDLFERPSLPDGTTINRYELSTRGFEVAHEREQSKTDHKINHSLVFFTMSLVMVEIVANLPMNAIEVLPGESPIPPNDFMVGIKLLLLIMILYFVYRHTEEVDI